MKIKEKVFIQNLTEVPDIPDTILFNVDKKIKKHNIIVNTLKTTVLLLVLSVSLFFFSNKQIRVSEKYDEEIISELQVAMDFFDSEKIDDELNMYTIIEPDIF